VIAKLWLTLWVCVLSSALLACGTAPNNGGTPDDDSDMLGLISGSVAYRERITLPRNAIITVSLLDLSDVDEDAPSVIAEQRIRPSQESPIPFTLQFDRSDINRGEDYGIAVVIVSDGTALWHTAAPIPVLTKGNPTDKIAITLERTP
jgi:putative lipoprotein